MNATKPTYAAILCVLALPMPAALAEQLGSISEPNDSNTLQIDHTDIHTLFEDQDHEQPESEKTRRVLVQPAAKAEVTATSAEPTPAHPETGRVTSSPKRDHGFWPSETDTAAEDASADQKKSQPIKRPDTEEEKIAGTQTEAADSEENDRAVSRSKAAGYPSLTDLWPLAVVLGVFAVAAILLKKAWPGKRLLMGSSMKIISRTAISSKQTLMMVKLGSRILVLGVTPDQINTLCVVEDPHQVALMLGEAVSDQPNSMTQAFAQAFRDESHAYEGRTEQHEEADAYEPPARSNRETVSNRPAESDEQLRGLLEKVRKMNREKSVA